MLKITGFFFSLLAMIFATALFANDIQTITWDDLIPEDYTPPPPKDPGFDSSWDELSEDSLAIPDQEVAPVVSTFNNELVKLPGFVIPLEVNSDGLVTEFLLVPYFGACIHVPPPPTNQVVYVKTEKGAPVDELYEAIWVTGKLLTVEASSQYATASYTIMATEIERYTMPAE